MPRAGEEAEADPNTVYVCWNAFCSDALPGSPVIKHGTRLRGDHPAVTACPQYFVSDGADESERNERHDEVYGTEAAGACARLPTATPTSAR